MIISFQVNAKIVISRVCRP